MFSAAWKMLKDTVLAFIDDEALSRGAAIASYTVTSIAPVLLIVIAIAGLASTPKGWKSEFQDCAQFERAITNPFDR
jgi:uncharacterized BrkB/YihY/UPF0761 family membrane protein